jgi:NitT/TauT family transport system permease protein
MVVQHEETSAGGGPPVDHELERRLLDQTRQPRSAPRYYQWLALTLTIAAFLVVWHLLPTLGLVNPLILPTPVEVAQSLRDLLTSGYFGPHFKTTMWEVFVGFFAGALLGFMLGVVFAGVPVLRKAFAPYILAMQALPKIVLAPLIIGWLGFGVESKIATAILICFFPMFINTMVGLSLTGEAELKFMRSLRASRWQTIRYVRVPTALPLIFVGLKHALLLAFTGVLVAEILLGTQLGLGQLVKTFTLGIQMGLAFAVIVVVAAIAIAMVTITDWLDRKIIFWRPDQDLPR